MCAFGWMRVFLSEIIAVLLSAYPSLEYKWYFFSNTLSTSDV